MAIIMGLNSGEYGGARGAFLWQPMKGHKKGAKDVGAISYSFLPRIKGPFTPLGNLSGGQYFHLGPPCTFRGALEIIGSLFHLTPQKLD